MYCEPYACHGELGRQLARTNIRIKLSMSENNNMIPWDYPEPFVIEVTASEEDIDGYGHVNNAVYVSWLDRCAFEHCDEVGLTADQCRELNRGMAAIRHEIDYIAAAYEGDQILVGDWVTVNDGKLRAQRRFQIIRVKDNRTLLRCVSNYVCTNLTNGRPARMPESFISRFGVLDSVADIINTQAT